MVFTPNESPNAPSRLAVPAAPAIPPLPDQQAHPVVNQPSQAHIDAATDSLNDAADAIDPQARLNRETDEENQRRYQAMQSEAKRKDEGIRAAQKQQEALNKHRETSVQINDHVVIDLEQVNEHQHTVGIRNAMKHLLHAGAHKASGKVSDIQQGPEGRILTVQAPNATYTVPELMATRADLYDGD